MCTVGLACQLSALTVIDMCCFVAARTNGQMQIRSKQADLDQQTQQEPRRAWVGHENGLPSKPSPASHWLPAYDDNSSYLVCVDTYTQTGI